MESDCISLSETNYFSDLVIDYIEGNQKLKSFYGNLPSIEGFRQQILKKEFDANQRSLLCKAIKSQYERDNVSLNQKHESQLASLSQANTFTVTTGHQLCLFTGPLYFIYKIISTIRLAEELTVEFPEHNFVPIYWMATEDHDFEEISFFNTPHGKVKWKTNQKGAVGKMTIDQFEKLSTQFDAILPEYSTNASELKKIFKRAYKKQNLAAATRQLVSDLFKNENLLILDGDDHSLKSSMKTYFKEELLNQKAFDLINETSTQLGKNYKIQVNPREINLFYLDTNVRERIEQIDEGHYALADKSKEWNKQDLLMEVEQFPERFSPNVILRPLYQEVILPNLAYIGGGGELAYWFQLKRLFDYHKVDFPILMLRNSAVFLNSKEQFIQEECDLTNADLFKDFNLIMKNHLKSTVEYDFELSRQKSENKQLYNQLKEDATAIDPTLVPHIESLQAKSNSKLEILSKKLERAFKRKEENYGKRLYELKEQTFPNESLQERVFNFSYLYLIYGKDLISSLKTNFSPLKFEFTILKEK